MKVLLQGKFEETYLDVRMQHGEIAADVWQEVRRDVRQHANAHAALTLYFAAVLEDALGGEDDAPGSGQKALARRRQGDALGVALEQPDAEVLLQQVDLLVQRRARDEQLLGCRRDAARLRDFDEGIQMLVVHGEKRTRRPLQVWT